MEARIKQVVKLAGMNSEQENYLRTNLNKMSHTGQAQILNQIEEQANLKNKALELRNNLVKAFNELNTYWIENTFELEFLNTEYPFNSCFNELTQDVNKWNDNK